MLSPKELVESLHHLKLMQSMAWITPLASWWRHQMEAFSALLALCAGNSAVTGEFQYKGQWHGALMFSLICAWINGWVNNREAGDLRRHRAHYDVIVMCMALLMRTLKWWLCNACNSEIPQAPSSKSRAIYTANKQRVLMHRHQGWNVRHGLCHIYMRYLYIYELFIAFVCFVVCSLL